MTSPASAPATPTLAERLEGRIARLTSRIPSTWLLRLIGEQPVVIDGRTLDPHVQFVLAATRGKRQIGMIEPTINAGRARYRSEILATTGSPTAVGAVRDITVDGGAGPLPARHYAPPSTTEPAAPLLLFLHGGGFVIGDLDSHDEPCRLLARYGRMHVISVAYRLAPEHPFPAAIDDSVAAMRWAQRHAATLGADPGRVGIGGDSAGANLAAVASLALAREDTVPAGQLLVYPVTDSNATGPSRALFATGFLLERRDVDAFRALYLGRDTRLAEDPRVSPIHDAKLALSPPTCLVTAGFDLLRDEGLAYGDALRLAGVRVHARCEDGLVHGFLHLTAVVPSARRAVESIAADFRALLDRATR